MKDVKEECDGEDAVSSSSHVTRFINASVQTPNKLLRMVAEEICGQSARKPHAERDFKVRKNKADPSSLSLCLRLICFNKNHMLGVCRKIKS